MKVTYDEVLGKLKKIVASKPKGYTYTTDPKAVETARNYHPNAVLKQDGVEFTRHCYYRFSDSTPGCLIGHLLYKYDPKFRPQEDQEGSNEMGCIVSFDEMTGRLIDLAQEFQDVGMTWSDALDKAVEETRGY